MAFTPEQQKAYRRKLKEEGVCIRCHREPSINGGAVCNTCSQVSIDRNRYRKENGLCKDCGGERDDLSVVRCVNCAFALNQYDQFRKYG